jgi:DNA-binding GntR family transcriptional regulator
MAQEISAAQRAYSEVKKRVLSGALGVKRRIDVAALAKDLGVSAMPVRQALAQLVWERLVRTGGGVQGFEVALWSVHELTQLYEWRGVLVKLALDTAEPSAALKSIVHTRPYPAAVLQLMRALEAGANIELRRAAQAADDRLQLARFAEEEAMGDVTGELENLVTALGERNGRGVQMINSFHGRRATLAATIRERVALNALPANGGHK